MKILLIAALFAGAAGPAQELTGGSFDFIRSISGNRDNQVRSVALGADGSIYIAGLTNSSDFTTTPQAARRVSTIRNDYPAEVFVRKLSHDGTQLIYSTLVGPARSDSPVSAGVDAAGNVYVAYRPEPSDPQPVQALELSGGPIAVKLSPDGSRFLYRVSLLPGAAYSSTIGLAVEKNGSVYVGAENSIRKIDPAGSRVEAQTTIACGDGGAVRVNALALGPDGSLYAAGRSACRAFPATANAYRSFTANPQNGDAFAVRFEPGLARAIYATLLGGESIDEAFALTVGRDGSATVAGQTAIDTGLERMPAEPLGISELKPNSSYGFAATLSPDGKSLKACSLFPSNSLTAVSSDSEGILYVAGTSAYSAVFAKVSPDLRALQYIVDAPARNARIASLNVSNGKLLFGASARASGFPDNDPSLAQNKFTGFFGSLAGSPVKTNLGIEVQASLMVPEIYGSYTTCRYVVTNLGPNDATRLLLAADIQGNASFQTWRAEPPVFNVPTFWTGFAGPTFASVARLGAGESAAVEFLSGNLIFSNGIRCSGRIYSMAAEEDLSDNEASSSKAPQWVRITVNAPNGFQFRRDDWPGMLRTGPGSYLTATPNSEIRLYFPPQNDSIGRPVKFYRWSDGSTDNPRTFPVGDKDFLVSASFSAVSETTPPDTDPGGGAQAPSTQTGETPLYMRPHQIAVGTPEPVIVVNGTGLREGWEALWNGEPRPTTYLNSYQLRMTLKPEDVERPSLSWISVRDPERNVIVRAPHAFWVYIGLPNNDVVYDRTRSRLWVAAPGSPGTSENQVVLVDPETGKIEQSMPLSAVPQKLALTDDAQYLYIAAPGRVYRLHTETLAIDQDFEMPATGMGPLPAQAYSMLTVPGRPNQVLVSLYAPFSSPGYSGTLLFENGVAFPRKLQPRDGPAFLYGWLDERTVIGGGDAGPGSALYYATVDNGIEMTRVLEGVLQSPDCLFESGLLYCNSGAVLDGSTGAYVRQYPARGAVGVAPGADRVVFFDRTVQVSPSGLLLGPMVTLRQSTSEFVSATTIPLAGSPGTVLRWGEDALIYRPIGSAVFEGRASGLYPFKVQ